MVYTILKKFILVISCDIISKYLIKWLENQNHKKFNGRCGRYGTLKFWIEQGKLIWIRNYVAIILRTTIRKNQEKNPINVHYNIMTLMNRKLSMCLCHIWHLIYTSQNGPISFSLFYPKQIRRMNLSLYKNDNEEYKKFSTS